MNRNEFISELSRLLNGIPEEEKRDILFDYDEHFRLGIEGGRNEGEIALALGETKVIAKQLRVNYMIERAENIKTPSNIFKAIFAAMGLGLLNIMFVLPFILAAFAVLLAFYATSVALAISGLAVFFGTFLEPLFPSFINIGVSSIVSLPVGVFLASIGMLFFIGSIYISKWFYKVTVNYLKMNISIISGKGDKNEQF